MIPNSILLPPLSANDRAAFDALCCRRPNAATITLRRALAAAANHDFVISNIGFATCLKELLDSPSDGFSALNGTDLVALKCKRPDVMGGGDTTSTTGFDDGSEYNLNQDAARWNYVMAHWPSSVKIRWFTFKSGMWIITGQTLGSTPTGNPIRGTFENFLGAGVGRESWDVVTVLASIRRHDASGNDYFAELPGTMAVDATTGVNTFTPSPTGPHRLCLPLRPKAQYASEIEALITTAP